MSIAYYILLTYAAGALGMAMWVHYLVLRDEHRIYLRSLDAYFGLGIWMLAWPVFLWRERKDF